MNRRLARLGATLAGTLARRRDLARQHLDLMARRLPDMRRSLVDLRLRVDERAEVLVRRARRAVIHQEQAPAAGHLPPLSPESPAGLGPRPGSGWSRRPRCWASACCRRQTERRRHLEYCQTHLEQLNPLAILTAGLRRGHPAPRGNGDSGRHPGVAGRGHPGPGGPGPDGLRSEGSEQ